LSVVAFLVFGPLFAARPMLAAFALACVVHFAQGLLGQPNPIEIPRFAMVLLGVAATAEWVLIRWRDWFGTLPSAWRAGFHAVSAGGCLALLRAPLSAEDALPIALAAGAAFICGRQWSAFRGELVDLDPTGILRLGLIVGAGEVLWTLGVAGITVFYPFLAFVVVGLSALTTLTSAVAMRLWEKRAEAPCGSCGKAIHACALVCRYCRTQRTASRASWNGRPGKVPAVSVAHQQTALTAVGRCARCALPAGSELLSVCRHCNEPRLTRAEAEQFIAAVDRRVPLTLAVCAAFSAIPLFGIVAGGIYYRLSGCGSLRRYVPWQRRLLARIFVTLATLLLVFVQFIPFIGIISVPAICFLNYAIDRQTVQAQLRAATEAPAVMAVAA
jgi:hypothetical protein